MKRLHVSVAVSDLGKSVQFYSTLFGTDPTVLKTDYAKWMLDDPRVNFSISSRGTDKGVDHLGIQVDDDAELAAVAGGSREPASRSSSRRRRLAAMPSRTKHGCTIPKVLPGRPSIPLARAPSMARTADDESCRCRSRFLLHPDAEQANAAASCCSPEKTPRTMAELARRAIKREIGG